MIKQLPAERPLARKQEILDDILADSRRHRRPWLVPVAAAASVAVVAGGLVFAASGQDDKPVPGPAARTTQSKPGTTKGKPKATEVQVNAGPLSAAEANALAEACVRQDYRPPGQVGQVSHAFKVRSWDKPGKTENSVVVLDKSNGLIYGCVGFPTDKLPTGETVEGFQTGLVGGDSVEARKQKSVINPTDATHPAVPTDSGGDLYSVRFDKAPDSLGREAWYRVDERVAMMRQRWVINGKPGPWYVADAADGFVFLRSWDKSTALRKGDEVRIETQVLAADGKPLDAPADQKGGGGLTPSPGTVRVDVGHVRNGNDPKFPPGIDFQTR